MFILKNKIIISKLILNQSASRWKLGIQNRFLSFSQLAIRHFESIFLNYDVSKFCGYKKNCHCQAAKFIGLSNFFFITAFSFCLKQVRNFLILVMEKKLKTHVHIFTFENFY